jgi:hypothetical protein
MISNGVSPFYGLSLPCTTINAFLRWWLSCSAVPRRV